MKKTDYKYKLWLKTPASWYKAEWKEALPTGNGIVGASVYGAVKEETILINHSSLWHWGVRGTLPDISSSLEITRELMEKKRYEEANEVSSKMLLDAGYQSELYKPCPIGDIKILIKDEKPFERYERNLNMETGEVSVEWDCNGTAYKRTVFVSRKDGVIVCRLQADKPVLDAEVFLQLHKSGGADYIRFKKEVKNVSNYTEEENIIGMKVKTEKESFGLLGKILYCNGSININKNRLLVKDASEVLLVFEPYVNEDFNHALLKFKDKVNSLSPNYYNLLEPHINLHNPLFHSAGFNLEKDELYSCSNEELLLDTYSNGASNTLIEKMWHYGRYLFVSGTSDTGRPFGMYGLWGGEYDLLWSHNMANINVQMIYWHALYGGYAQYLKTLVNYYYDLREDFKNNAKNIFGLNGIWMPAGTTPGYGLANQVVPVITNWIGGAGWLCQHFYDYYRYTGDEILLNEKILPLMLESAQFYEEYLVLVNGECCIVPSVSPENSPGNLNIGTFRHMSHACPTAKNATMDIAIIKELLTNLIALCTEKNIYSKKCETWKEIIDKLPSYQINQDGAVKEWLSEEFSDFYYHRHCSHCYPVFPGKEVTKEKSPDLFKAFLKAVDLRILGGQSGWSLAYMACLYARFEKGKEAYHSLDILCKSCLTNSFFTLHNDWRKMGLTLDMSQEFEDEAPVQMDANMGLVAAVQEMLLYNDGTIVRLLPAIPEKWKKGDFSNFRLSWGNISCKWDMDNKYMKIEIVSNMNQNLHLYLPHVIYGKKEVVRLSCKKQEPVIIEVDNGNMLNRAE